MKKVRIGFAALTAFLLTSLSSVAAQDKPIVVFAAASMKNALDEASAAFADKSGLKTIASYAASSALVRQIKQGAPAEIFISADTEWMDHAVAKRLVRPESRVDLVGNKLVLIAPATSSVGSVKIDKTLDLAGLAQGGRIAVADTRAVPAGKYAKAALERLSLLSQAEPRFAMAENVRAALALAARGEAALAVVYASDAQVEPKVRIVGEFPADSHAPIIYPAALTVSARPEAARYLEFLRSAEAKPIFERFGFVGLR